MEVIITASLARQKVFEGKVDSVDSLLEASWSFVELLALPGITEKGQDALQDLVPFSFVEGELEAFLTLWSCETWVLYGAVTSSFVNSRFGAMIWVHCRLATRRGGCGGGPLILELQSSRSELCIISNITSVETLKGKRLMTHAIIFPGPWVLAHKVPRGWVLEQNSWTLCGSRGTLCPLQRGFDRHLTHTRIQQSCKNLCRKKSGGWGDHKGWLDMQDAGRSQRLVCMLVIWLLNWR